MSCQINPTEGLSWHRPGLAPQRWAKQQARAVRRPGGKVCCSYANDVLVVLSLSPHHAMPPLAASLCTPTQASASWQL
jgi:hypothetical protein